MTVDRGRLDAIARYPVKGFTAQLLDGVELRAGSGLPFDRRYAIGNGWRPVDGGAWAPCSSFLRLNRNRDLARFGLSFNAADDQATLRHPEGETLVIDFRVPGSVDAANQVLARWFAAGPLGPPKLQVADQAFWDMEDGVLSLINVASVDALSAMVGLPLDPLRFRGNLMLTGFAAWSELAWPGQVVAVGDCELEILRPIARCGAPSVNPATGEQDTNLLAALESGFGHQLMGVYARVRRGGRIEAGDGVTVLGDRAPAVVAAGLANPEGVRPAQWPRTATIAGVEPCGEGMAHVWVTDGAAERQLPLPAFRPGQHLRLHTPAGWRSYTVTGRRPDAWRITIRRVAGGPVSGWLHAARPGERLDVTGPFGDVVYPDPAPRQLVILAAGSGITPAFTLLEAAARQPVPPEALVVHVGRGVGPAAYWHELETLLRGLPEARTQRFATGVDPAAAAREGRIAGRPDLGAIDWRRYGEAAFFVCGPPAFVGDARAALAAAGIAEGQVYEEPFFSPRPLGDLRPRLPPAAGPFRVRFRGAATGEAVWEGEASLLVVADAAGVAAEASCRSGACGKCRQRVTAGTVAYVVDPTAAVPAGQTLLCCAVPTSDIEITLRARP